MSVRIHPATIDSIYFVCYSFLSMLDILKSIYGAVGSTEDLLSRAWTSIQHLAAEYPATAIAVCVAAGFSLLAYKLTRNTLRWNKY